MNAFAWWLIVPIVLLLTVYLLLKFNKFWIYCFDNALRNPRDHLSRKYELPRYFVLTEEGQVDTSVKWPGWDGWYFIFMPVPGDQPLKMIRASDMTGLYGLNGIDDYAAIPSGLNAFQVVEYLAYIVEEIPAVDESGQPAHVSHTYLPKKTDLTMSVDSLDTIVTNHGSDGAGDSHLCGRVTGSWPNYEVGFEDSELKMKLDLNFDGLDLLWWADIPGIFTYFAAFGTFEAKMSRKRIAADSSGESSDDREIAPLSGFGFFEHGCARKPFSYDCFWAPVNWLKRLCPSFKPVQYHYEVFAEQGKFHGGFMYARGFGLTLRNLGGIYSEDSYEAIDDIRIEYLDDPPPDLVPTPGPGGPVKFYKKWKVTARARAGVLEYTATRIGAPAQVASNMMYYCCSVEGTYNGSRISARGYGEYVHI